MRTISSTRRFPSPQNLLWVVLLLPLSPVRADPHQARDLEKQGRWFEACCLYDELLSQNRNQPELREAYRRCLRQFRQQRRLDDQALQTVLAKLSVSEAGDLYDQVLEKVVKYYAERVDPTVLFQQGLGELRSSTQQKGLVQRYANRVSEADLAEFRTTLDRWEGQKVRSVVAAGEWARKIIVAGSQLNLPPGVVALELACGAANSLDEYSLYLSPARVTPAEAALKNKIVGIGAEVVVVGQRLEISRVYRKSPAADAGLVKGDRITRIDGHEPDLMAPDLVGERLLGEAGTFVELEVSRGEMMPQMVKLERRAVMPNSVDAQIRTNTMGEEIGYMQIHSFQESTLQEVKDVLEVWRTRPLRGAIIDLRGNSGGVFKSAVAIAELFLPESVIAHTVGQHPDVKTTFRSRNAAPYTVPLAVLVDGETASAAEVLAGALKDNQRAILVGQTTFGKATIQGVFPLKRGPGGLRLTVAKFTTPSRMPLGGKGLQPDIPVSIPDSEAVIRAAEFALLGKMMLN